jgi:hypothetical protein
LLFLREDVDALKSHTGSRYSNLQGNAKSAPLTMGSVPLQGKKRAYEYLLLMRGNLNLFLFPATLALNRGTRTFQILKK